MWCYGDLLRVRFKRKIKARQLVVAAPLPVGSTPQGIITVRPREGGEGVGYPPDWMVALLLTFPNTPDRVAIRNSNIRTSDEPHWLRHCHCQ